MAPDLGLCCQGTRRSAQKGFLGTSSGSGRPGTLHSHFGFENRPLPQRGISPRERGSDLEALQKEQEGALSRRYSTWRWPALAPSSRSCSI